MVWKWSWPDLSYCPFIYLQLMRKTITLICKVGLQIQKRSKSLPPQEKQQQECQTFVGSDRWWMEIVQQFVAGRALAVGGTVQ
jgi:hypothetical protein